MNKAFMDYINQFKLKNKIAYVFGGLGLIGTYVSEALYSAGAKVIILDNNKIKINQSTKSNKNKDNLKYKYFDVSKLDKIETNFNKINKIFGLPDVVINASYPRTSDIHKNNLDNLKTESFNQNIKMHLNSYILIARISAEIMKKNKIKGSIVQLSSIYGLVGQDLNIYKNTKMKENITYSVIKGGINNATKTMCAYYGKYNIRINNLAPGGLIGHVVGQNKKQEANFIKNYSFKVPLNRLGKPQEIACAALFLSSNASSYVTGTTIIVDGGWTAI